MCYNNRCTLLTGFKAHQRKKLSKPSPTHTLNYQQVTNMESSEFNRKLEELFSYHPPKTDEERAKHEQVNQASIAYAKSLAGVVENPAELTTILREIQKVRMLANAAVCYQRVGISYRGLFDQQQ